MNGFSKSLGSFRPIYRGIPIIVLTTILGVLIAKKYLKYTTPLYESTAKIKLADIHEGITNSNLFKDFDVFATSNKIGAEVELLKSKALIAKAISKLDLKTSFYRVGEVHKTELYNQTPFYVEARIEDKKLYDKIFEVTIHNDSLINLKVPSGKIFKTKFNQIIAWNGNLMIIKLNTPLLKKRPDLQLNDSYEFIIHSEDRLIHQILSDLDVMAVDKDIPVLRISYKSPVPQKSADVVNALSAAYITDYIDEKYKSADTTESFLNKQLKAYSKNLSNSEYAIENYRDDHKIINIHQETETDLRKISDLKKQLASVQMNLIAIDSLNIYMRKGSAHFLELAPNFEAFTDLLSTEMVKKVKELQRERRDLLLKYTPVNEKVKVVDDKLLDIQQYLEESIKNTEHNLRIKYNDLNESITTSEKVFKGLPDRERNMGILDRNFGLNEQIYRFLHEKRTEAEIAKAATISFHRIISEGEVSEKPISPNYVIIKVMAAILGLFGGIGLVYGVHMLKARVNDEETVSRLSDIPFSAAVPYFRSESSKITFFTRWMLQLDIKGLLKEGNVITISSFSQLEGKSFIKDGLISALKILGKKILILEELEKKEEINSVAKWKAQINAFKNDFDVILIKNQALKNHSSAMVLMAASNLNFFILDSRITKKSVVEEIENLKQELQLPNIQFVLNRAGYTPSLFIQAKSIIVNFLKRSS